jgi:type IV pilus assembly protein PilB
MSSEIRKLIMSGGTADDIRDSAVSDGMLTLRMDGLKKLEKGVTTLEEVMKETAAGA